MTTLVCTSTTFISAIWQSAEWPVPPPPVFPMVLWRQHLQIILDVISLDGMSDLEINAYGYKFIENWNCTLFSEMVLSFFIFGTACQIYCYGRYCVRRSVSLQVPENPSGPLVDNFTVLPCVAFGVACVELLPGVDRWNSLDDPRVIGPCHCEVWGWPRH